MKSDCEQPNDKNKEKSKRVPTKGKKHEWKPNERFRETIRHYKLKEVQLEVG